MLTLKNLESENSLNYEKSLSEKKERVRELARRSFPSGVLDPTAPSWGVRDLRRSCERPLGGVSGLVRKR